MKKMITLGTLLLSLSTFAVMPAPGTLICGKLFKTFDSVELITTRGIFELTTYDKLSQVMLESFGNGKNCCVGGDVRGDSEIIVDKVVPSMVIL